MQITGTHINKIKDAVRQPLPELNQTVLADYVNTFQKQAASYISICRQHGSPLYIFDQAALLHRAQQFTSAFKEYFAEFQAYFAVKSNNHPSVAATLVDFGLGLDVSSGLELEAALRSGCRDILFSGPGKTEHELRMAVKHHRSVTVLMDSFGELAGLEKAARKEKSRVRSGVRLCTNEKGLWRKFGIPLSDLGAFMSEADQCPHIDVAGLQFHTSWNLNPKSQTAFLARLSENLRSLSAEHLSAIKFVDIGGGYWPSRGEWLQPYGTPSGRVLQSSGIEISNPMAHYGIDAVSIETFAERIAAAMETHIFPLVSCNVKAEPGRWLCDDAMHILVTVIDKKAEDLVITDGGIHLIGWERFETDYAPVINLTRPSRAERQCLIMGSLCTPHDIWGYGYFGNGIEPGDVLLIPGQGAYTYSLRQHFIKPLAKIVNLINGKVEQNDTAVD